MLSLETAGGYHLARLQPHLPHNWRSATSRRQPSNPTFAQWPGPVATAAAHQLDWGGRMAGGNPVATVSGPTSRRRLVATSA
jgi:hypothetical protein